MICTTSCRSTPGEGGREGETSHTIALGIWSIVLHSYIDVEQAVLVNVGFGKRAWKRCQAGQKGYEDDDVQHIDGATPVDVAQKEWGAWGRREHR